ncbi:MAG: hypothetical protein WC373_01845 [Smithella sp.]|jgi:hypothetical protein
MSENKKWMSSGYLKSAPSGKVDSEKGIIEGVSVCTVGEAEGHGVYLDDEFIEVITKLGSEKKQGLKARFGHPNMCSTALGTFIGRFKNFRKIDNQTKADLFLSNEAKETPHGNLYDYVLGMAKNEPDMFGTSIVFTPGRHYRKDEEGNKWYRHIRETDNEWEVWYENEDGEERENEEGLSKELFIECKELHACDTVDEPAANDGLFSRFSQETVAGQLTEFLDLNPHVWESISENPSILESLAKYADKIDEFITRYRNYRKQNEKGNDKMSKPKSEHLEENVVAEPASETPKETTPVEPAESEPQEETTQQETKTIDVKEFESLVKEFGSDIASKVVLSGGGISEAYKLKISAQEEKIKALEAKVPEAAKLEGGEPAKPSAENNKPKSIFKKDRE